MRSSIAIIGSGAAGLSSLYAYIQGFEGSSGLPSTIFCFDKSGTFGPGEAYQTDSSVCILNTKTGFISPFYDRPSDFFRWLKAHEKSWKPSYPDYTASEQSYAPRGLFGLYLRHEFGELVKRAASKGISVTQIQAEVADVQAREGGFTVSTTCNLSVHVSYVLLTCGTVPPGERTFGTTPDTVFHNPYPVSALSKAIPKDASVAIIGSRLSGIDAALGLFAGGHQGAVAIHSRSGYFPSVRGTQGRLKPSIFTIENLQKRAKADGFLRLQDIIEIIEAECAHQGEVVDNFRVPQPSADLSTFLDMEIRSASQPRAWQAVLYSSNPFIDRLWGLLHPDDKHIVMGELLSAFLSYRVSFPIENAKSIQALIRSGSLDFIPGAFSVHYGDRADRHVLSMQHGASHSYDYIVWAVGAPRDILYSESILVHNLLKRGIVSRHIHGGICVDPATHRVIGSDGKAISALRAVGELTNGEFFFTSALEIIAIHSRRCIDSLISDISILENKVDRSQSNDLLNTTIMKSR